MTINNSSFTILSKGNNDVIDMTSKIQDIINGFESTDGLIYVSTKEENIGFLIIENNIELIKKLITIIENTIEKDTPITLEDINLNNKLKNQFIKNNLTLSFNNKILNIEKNQRIFMVDFNYSSRIREIITATFY